MGCQKVYKTGIYIRLSKEDEHKKNKADFSESVKNQKALCQEYINRSNENFQVYKTYIDDGVSGTDTKGRKAFLEMMDDVNEGNIDCVITKKLDRLGRNEADTFSIMFNDFVKKDIRFIAFNDNYDSNEDRYAIGAAITNVVNADYSRKLSSNVCNTLNIKKSNGDFIGAFACYGYKKDENNKNHLVIDEPAAEIVRRIFDEYLHGKGQVTIARDLNLDNIPCPSEYKAQNGLNYHNSNKKATTIYWSYSTIHNLLKQKMYVGDMWQNRNCNRKYEPGTRTMPKERQILVKNTHEPIISRADFELVQQKLANNRDISTKLNQNLSPYAGHIFCECGQVMSKITNKRKGVAKSRYVCRSYKSGSKICTSHSINMSDLDIEVLNFLNDMIKSLENMKEVVKKAAKDKNITAMKIEADIGKLNAEIARQNKRISGYEDLFADGEMSKERFLEKKKKCLEIIELNTQKIESLSTNVGKSEEEIFLENPIISALLSVGRFESIDKEIVDTFIKKIIVHEDENGEKSIEIIPTFNKM